MLVGLGLCTLTTVHCVKRKVCGKELVKNMKTVVAKIRLMCHNSFEIWAFKVWKFGAIAEYSPH